MVKLSDVKAGTTSILLLGGSGTGKTHFLATVALKVPSLMVTTDGQGLDTVRRLGANPDVALISEWRDVVEGARAVSAFKGTALLLDDLSFLQRTIEQRVEGKPRKDEYRMKPAEQAERRESGLLLGERRLEIQQRGEVYVAFWSFLELCMKANVRYVVATALEDTEPSPRTGRPAIYPALQRGMRYTLAARFSLVLSLWIAEVGGSAQWAATCRAHPYLPTKSRLGGGRTWIDPSYERIVLYLSGADEPETELERRLATGLTAAQ